MFGVVKAYTTRVGDGAFPTEQLNVCSTTRHPVACSKPARPRRMWARNCRSTAASLASPRGGAADAAGSTWSCSSTRTCSTATLRLPAAAHRPAHRRRICLTKLDILGRLPELKIGVAYKHRGHVLPSFPGMARPHCPLRDCATSRSGGPGRGGGGVRDAARLDVRDPRTAHDHARL